MALKQIPKIKKLFEVLDQNYKWLGWWPSTPENGAEPEYHRDSDYIYSEKEIYEIIFGAILTQNAAWINVVKALTDLRKIRVFSPEDILKTDETEILEAIRPSGYFNQKLKKLRHIAEFFRKNKIKDLKKMNIEIVREKLLGIWGVGRETADSILLYALDKNVFVVDAYTRRVLKRKEIIEGNEDYDFIRILIESSIPADLKKFKNYHASIVELCKKHCRIKPNCPDCPAGKISKCVIN